MKLLVGDRKMGARRFRVAVLEAGQKAKRGQLECRIGEDVQFKAGVLQTYFFKGWDARLYDALLVAGVVEYCDRSLRRRAAIWSRAFEVQIPVHDSELWNGAPLSNVLHRLLNFLTGDSWRITFVQRRKPAEYEGQTLLEFPVGAEAVMPFSDGLDSLAVAGILNRKLGDGLVRVRLGNAKPVHEAKQNSLPPFSATPFLVSGWANQF